MRTNDGIVLADQILQEGSASPADVYLTENSPELMNLEEHGLLAKLPGAMLDQVPARTIPRARLGRGGAAGREPRLQPRADARRRTCRPRCSIWRSPSGRARSRSPRPTRTSRRWSARVIAATARGRGSWLAGLKRNAQTLPGRRGGGLGRQPRRRRRRDRQPVLLVPVAAGGGGEGDAQPLYFFPDHNVGSIENISGAAVLASSRAPGRRRRSCGSS